MDLPIRDIAEPQTGQLPNIDCDFDGVLVDFERGYELQYGVKHNSVPEFVMWKTIRENMTHWEQLPAMPGALQLWAFIAPYNPRINTGCPSSGFKMASEGKTIWKNRELGEHVEIITGFSRHKAKHMRRPGDILIDDMEKNINRWVEAGGVGVLHVNAADTIRQLKALGF